MTIPLRCMLPYTSSDLPEQLTPKLAAVKAHCSYLILLLMGFTLPLHIAANAVRSYRTFSPLPEGGIFSVALSLRSLSLAVNQHHFPWSPDFPRLHAVIQSSGVHTIYISSQNANISENGKSSSPKIAFYVNLDTLGDMTILG
jgi:hypothetical protein